MQHLVIPSNIKGIGLGDRIDYLCTANMIAQDANDDWVTIYKNSQYGFKGWDELSSLFKPRHMILELVDGDYDKNLKFLNYPKYNIGYNHRGTSKLVKSDYQDLLTKFKDFTKIIPKDFSSQIKLPEKFVTMQWDAAEFKRRCTEDEVVRIIEFYKNMGYKTIAIGGQSSTRELRNDLHKIAYVISKADLHVGVDSGFMHLAKIILPSNKLHIYTSNYADIGTGIGTSSHFRNVLKAGAISNYSRE